MTLLPGRGMNVLQIRVFVPGRGEIDLLDSPSVAEATRSMTGSGEDAEGGRCYIPTDWLNEAGLDEQTLLDPDKREALGEIGQRLATMAAAYEKSARVGASALPFRCCWAVLAAAGIYGDIAREVKRRGAKAWDSRVVTSNAAKLGWIVRAVASAATRPGMESTRNPRPSGLWARARVRLQDVPIA